MPTKQKNPISIQWDLLMLCKHIMKKLTCAHPKLKHLMYNSKGTNDDEWGYWHSEGVGTLHRIMQEYKKKSIIDLGCGLGLLMAQLECTGDYRVGGLDNEQALIAHAFINNAKRVNLLRLEKEHIKDYEVLYMWEPIRNNNRKAKMLANRLIQCMEPEHILIYNCAGSIGRFLQESKKFDRKEKYGYCIYTLKPL